MELGNVAIGAAFLAGLISFVSPCVLPLVPSYLGFLTGATIEELTADARHVRRRALVVAFAFVLGFSTVFVALGATASAVGRLLLSWSLELGVVAGVFIIVMGLHFLGVFRIPLLYREARFQASGARSGPAGAYVMGLAFAFGWTPCLGPTISAILGVAGSRDTVLEGAALLAIYAAGLGVPFLLVALFAGPAFRWMSRFRRHLGLVEKAMGALLVVTGILFLTGGLQRFSWWLLETFPVFQTIG
jgi:cytochrome c-type biogenesis protein